MNNGCICCSVRGDLIRILGRLLKRKDRLDGILIETTGLANPAPVAQTFFTDPEIRAAFRLDAIVTVVDAKHAVQHLEAEDESVKQIAFADVILLNKIDLAGPAERDALEARIRRINSVAKIYPTENCALPIDRVLGVGGFNLSRATELDPKFLETEYPFEWAGAYELPAGTHELVIGHDDDKTAMQGTHSLLHPEEGHEHHHHHHGNENELDLVVLPPPGLDAGSMEAAEAEAVRLFSDWEARVKDGDTFQPGATLHRPPPGGPRPFSS